MNPSSITSTAELLTIEMFAQRLHVSRATIFAWMQKQILVQGRHFIKFGRVVRFVWSDNLLETLLADSATDENKEPIIKPVRAAKAIKASPINWEY